MQELGLSRPEVCLLSHGFRRFKQVSWAGHHGGMRRTSVCGTRSSILLCGMPLSSRVIAWTKVPHTMPPRPTRPAAVRRRP